MRLQNLGAYLLSELGVFRPKPFELRFLHSQFLGVDMLKVSSRNGHLFPTFPLGAFSRKFCTDRWAVDLLAFKSLVPAFFCPFWLYGFRLLSLISMSDRELGGRKLVQSI